MVAVFKENVCFILTYSFILYMNISLSAKISFVERLCLGRGHKEYGMISSPEAEICTIIYVVYSNKNMHMYNYVCSIF